MNIALGLIFPTLALAHSSVYIQDVATQCILFIMFPLLCEERLVYLTACTAWHNLMLQVKKEANGCRTAVGITCVPAAILQQHRWV